MHQTIHILKKDIHHLRAEIALVLGMAILYAWLYWMTYPWWALVAAAGVFMIVRLIHAEAIPGDDQFWITRPYRWTSLLGAKLLFILAFLGAPVLGAQLVVLVRDGFPVFGSLTEILWSSALLFFVVAVPVAALASITRNILQFLVMGFVAVPVIQVGLTPAPINTLPAEVEWPRLAAAAGLLAFAAATILFNQYRTRKTGGHRLVAVGSAVVSFLFLVAMPFSIAMRAQELVGPSDFDGSEVEIRLNTPIADLPDTPFGRGWIRLELPFMASNAPSEVVLVVDAFEVVIEDEDGTAVDARQVEGNGFSRRLAVPREVYEAWDGMLTIQARFYITAFGDPQRVAYRPSETPSEVADRLRCRTQSAGEDVRDVIQCRRPHRWPAARMHVSGGGRSFFSRLGVSYSPFPSGIDLNAFGASRGTIPRGTPEVQIRFDRPLGHFRKDFQATVGLDDVAVN